MWRRLRVTVFALLGVMLIAAGPAAAQGTPAAGHVEIENEELDDPEPGNEPKVGCAFEVHFLGFREGTYPVSFRLQAPSGDGDRGTLLATEVTLADGRGNEVSGVLPVDLTAQLTDVEPAQAADFDHKVRVDVIVKETPDSEEGQGQGTEVTRSKMLFILCAPEAAADEDGGAGDDGAVLDGSEEGDTTVLDGSEEGDTTVLDGSIEAEGAEGATGIGGSRDDLEVLAVGEEAQDEVIVPVGGVDAGSGPVPAPAGSALLAAVIVVLAARGASHAARQDAATQQRTGA